MGKGSNGVGHHEVVPHDRIPICNVGHIEVPGSSASLRLIRAVQALMFPEFHTDSGPMGATTHDLSVADLQADRSPAGLQEFLLEQPSPDQAHLGTRIH